MAPQKRSERGFFFPTGFYVGQGTIEDNQKRCKFKIATYLTCHTSINAGEDSSDMLQEEVCLFKMHRTKCTAVITFLLAPHLGENKPPKL